MQEKPGQVVYSVQLERTSTSKAFERQINAAIEQARTHSSRPELITKEFINNALANLITDLKPFIDNLEKAFMERETDPFSLSDEDKAINNFEEALRKAKPNENLTYLSRRDEYYTRGLFALTEKNNRTDGTASRLLVGLLGVKRSSAEEILNAASHILIERGVTPPKFEHILEHGKPGTLFPREEAKASPEPAPIALAQAASVESLGLSATPVSPTASDRSENTTPAATSDSPVGISWASSITSGRPEPRKGRSARLVSFVEAEETRRGDSGTPVLGK